MEKVNEKIKELENKFKFNKVKKVSKDPKVISYLNILQEQYVMCPIDKAANFQVLLKELSSLNITSNTYQQVIDTLHKVLQQQNNTLNSIFGLKNNDVLIVFHLIISCQKCIKYHLM